jgi:hypothetical protein
MTEPAMPDAETFEYLPTQVIAEYLASEVNPSLDGILYRSSQAGHGKNNIVLFHHASLVEELSVSDDTAIFVETGVQTPDGYEPDYWVLERDDPDHAPDDTSQQDANVPKPTHGEIKGEEQQPALRIDLTSIVVHHIEGVLYRHSDFDVRRPKNIGIWPR